MTDSETTGFVTRYLLAGPYQDAQITLEFENARLIGATDQTGEDIPLDAIGQEDFERALEALNYDKLKYEN